MYKGQAKDTYLKNCNNMNVILTLKHRTKEDQYFRQDTVLLRYIDGTITDISQGSLLI